MAPPNEEDDPLKARAAALGRVPSGLFILTARQGAVETGMLTSWVQQCSFEPLLISVALRKGRDLHDWLVPGALFVLNILGEGQTNFLTHFGKGFALGQPAFNGLEVARSEGGLPVLADALAYLECRVEARHSTGDHELLLGEVIGGKLLHEGPPRVHVRKSGLRY